MEGNYLIKDQLECSGAISESEYADLGKLVETTLQAVNKGEYSPEQMGFIKKYTAHTVSLKKKTGKSYGIFYIGKDEKGESVLQGSGFLADRGDGWEIITCYVSPDCQGKGIGSAIVDKLEEKAKSLGIKDLYLISFNFKNTLGFYEKKGYVKKQDLSFDASETVKLNFTKMEKSLDLSKVND